MTPPEAGISFVDESRLLASLSPGEAADALAAALREPATLPESPPRTLVASGSGELLTMPAAGIQGAGAKLVSVQPLNPDRGLPLVQGVFVLFEPDELRPVAVLDGAALTRLRTPAVSLLATRALAREGVRHLVVFGSGVQARAHALALLSDQPIERVTVVDAAASADAFVEALRGLGVEAVRGEAEAVADANLICTCTTADTPLFDGGLLRPGVHVNAVGSYQPHTREIDTTTLRRSTVFVEDRTAVLETAGDLRLPITEGAFSAEQIRGDLGDLARGERSRRDPEEITCFKSVGRSWEDLVVALAAWRQLAAT